MDSPKIKHITPLSGTYRLHVRWGNGMEDIVDFGPIIQRFKILKPLNDLDYFGKVAIIEGGWMIGWPGNIDYAADNLWTRAQEQMLKKAG